MSEEENEETRKGYTQLFCEMHLSEAGVRFHLPLFFFPAKLIIQQTRRGEEKTGRLKSTR